MTATASSAPVRDQIRSEFIKIRSARALLVLPILAGVLGPATALIVGLTGSIEPDDTRLGGALTGVNVSLAVMAAWGALVVTVEFSSGTIRPVLAATPQRGTVLAAKSIAVAGIATATGVFSATLAYLVGLASIDSTKYAAGEPIPGLFGIYGCFPAVALTGLAAGVVLRSSAGAVAVAAAYVVLPQLPSAQALGDLHKWMTLAAPSTVVAKLSQSSDAAPAIVGTLGGWPRLAIVVVCTAGALASAHRILNREDV